MPSASGFLKDEEEGQPAPAESTPTPKTSAASFLKDEAPADSSAGSFLNGPEKKEDPLADHLLSMMFMDKFPDIKKVADMTMEASRKFVPTFLRSAKEITRPITEPVGNAKTPAGRIAAVAKGVADFAARPFTEEIPGSRLLGDKIADTVQTEKGIEDEVARSGNIPYGMITKRVAGKMLGDMVPKTGLDAAMMASIPGTVGAGESVLKKLLPSLDRPLLRGAEKAASEAVPTLTREMMLPNGPGGMSMAESPATVKAIEQMQPGTKMAAPASDPVKDVASRIVRKFKGEKEPYTLDNLYQDTINRFHSIEKYTDMAKQGEIPVRPGEDPGLLARSYLGMTGKVNSFLEHNTFRLDADGNVQFAGPGLKKILEPVRDNLEDFSNYLVSRRAMSLSERGIESGVDIGQAQKAVMNLEAKNPMFKEIAESHIQKWQDDLLQYLKDSGRIGEGQYKAIKEANDFYAPMQRVLEEGSMDFNLKNRDVFNRVVNPVKKIEGSEAKIIDPLESMVKNSFHIIDAADRNRVAKSVISLRTKNPALADAIQIVSKPGKDTITGYFGGQPVHAKLPKELLSSMRGLSEEQAGWLQKILQFPTAVLRAGATLSPEFAVRNPIRDQWSAMVNSKYGFKPFYDSLRGAFSIAKADDAYWRWQASGGAQSFLVSMDRTINDMLWAPPKGYKEELASYIKNPLKIFQEVSEGMEKPTRVGLFKKAKEAGVSDIEAGFESREGTVDFARRGMQARGLNALYAFFNARLQGVDKTYRAFKENPAKATLAASPLTVASIALHMANRGDPEWKEIPQWQKDLFWMTKVKGKWVKIPKGDLGIIFGSSAEHVMDYLDNHEPGKMASFAFDTLSNISPVDFNNGGLVPTAIKPVIENLANYNYFLKRQIVSEGKQGLLPEYQFSRIDTETAKQIGKVLNVSPSKVTNLITGYTGGMGRLGLQAADAAGKAAGVFDSSKDLPTHAEDVPGVKGFFVREPSGSSSQSVNDFYKSWDDVQQAHATIKKYPGQIKEISEKHPEWRAFGLFNSTSAGLSDLRKLRDTVINSKMDGEAKEKKLQSINAQMTKLARTANETLANMKKANAAKKPKQASAGAFLNE